MEKYTQKRGREEFDLEEFIKNNDSTVLREAALRLHDAALEKEGSNPCIGYLTNLPETTDYQKQREQIKLDMRPAYAKYINVDHKAHTARLDFKTSEMKLKAQAELVKKNYTMK